jgi:hypothetical protein
MCATLHRNSSFTAHGAQPLSGTTTGRCRSAIRLVRGTQPCRVSEIWSGTRLILEATPPDQPRITIRARAPEPRPAPIFRLRFSGPEPSPRKPGSVLAQPHPIRPGEQPPRSGHKPLPLSGQAARWPLGPAAPIQGIHPTSMTKPTMTSPTPAIPMARAHPLRGASPWPNLPRSGQTPHATPAAPFCPLPRRSGGAPGRPAPTWEELLGQR